MSKQINIALIIFAFVFTNGCVKMRPDVDAQGSNLAALKNVNGLHNKTCTVTTFGGENELRSFAVAESKAQITGDKFNFPKVRNVVESDCPFLMDNKDVVDFKSSINDEDSKVTHNVIYKVERDQVMLYKVVKDDTNKADISSFVAKQSMISHFEKPYSTKVNGGSEWHVPVASFKITGFYNKKQRLNSDGRETNTTIKEEVLKDDYKKTDGRFNAAYVSINTGALEAFETEDKINVVPKTYFKGEWYFNKTIINKSMGARSGMGNHGGSAFDMTGWSSSNLVEFSIEENNLFGLGLGVDQRLNDETKINLPLAITIPIENVSFRREEAGAGELGAKEELHKVQFDKAEFVQLNLIDSETARGTSFLSKLIKVIRPDDKRKTLTHIEISENYFSFTIQEDSVGTVSRYSFLKKDSRPQDYEPKIAFGDDMRKFGYFTNHKMAIRDENLVKLDDYQKNVYVVRHNPKRDIVYYFSDNTPKEKWIRDIGRESVKLWNQAFKKADLKIQIRLEESKDVPLGDIRYNVLNMMDDKYLNNPYGGYGPALQDPHTGEIISTTSNVAVRTSSYYRLLKYYINKEVGKTVSFSNRSAEKTAPSQTDMFFYQLNNDLITKNENGEKELLPLFRWADQSQTSVVNTPVVKDLKNIKIDNFDSSNETIELPSIDILQEMSQESITKNGTFLMEAGNSLKDGGGISHYTDYLKGFIEKHCPIVTAYISDAKNNGTLPTVEENKKLENCVMTMTQVTNVGVTMHEIGHTIGFRHNFFASADKHNFESIDAYHYDHIDLGNLGDKMLWSSVMDYTDFYHPGVGRLVPGKYDVANLRFGYANQVELAPSNADKFKGNGNFVYVPKGQSLRDYAKSSGQTVKKYKFCTDTDGYTIKAEVFCKPWDLGTTATEITSNYAKQILSHLSQRAYTFDGYSANSQLFVTTQLINMKAFYDQWRDYVAIEVGNGRKYLESLSEEEYQIEVDKMLKSANGEVYKDFLQARNIFANLLLDLAYLPNKYCVVKTASDKTKLIELSTIRVALQEQGEDDEVRDCKHAGVTAYLAAKELVLDREVGYFLFGGKFSLDKMYLNNPAQAWGAEPLDFAGTAMLRTQAAQMMTTRYTQSRDSLMNSFAPNLLDEPDIRKLATKLIFKRLSEGVFISEGTISPEKYSYARLMNDEDYENRTKGALISENYKEESWLVETFYASFFSGLSVPGNPSETFERRKDFSTDYTNNPSVADAPQYKALKLSASRFLFTSNESNTYASEILDIVNGIDAALEADKNPAQAGPTLEDFKPEVVNEALTQALALFNKHLIAKEKVYFGSMFSASIEMRKELIAMDGKDELKFKQFLLSNAYNILMRNIQPQVDAFVANLAEKGIIGDMDALNKLINEALPENFLEVEDFMALAGVERPTDGTPEAKAYDDFNTELVGFFKQDITPSFYQVVPSLKTEESYKSLYGNLIDDMKSRIEQAGSVQEAKDEKLAQRSLLINVLLQSIQ